MYLLIQCALSSISPLKKGRGERRPFKLGLLVCSHTGLALECFEELFRQAGWKCLSMLPPHTGIRCFIQLTNSAPGERVYVLFYFFPVRRSWTARKRPRLQPFSFVLSPWDCKQGRGTTLFSLMFGGENIYNKRRTARRDEWDLNNAVKAIISAGTSCRREQRCGMERLLTADPPWIQERGAEPWASRCCRSHREPRSVSFTSNPECPLLMGGYELAELAIWQYSISPPPHWPL